MIEEVLDNSHPIPSRSTWVKAATPRNYVSALIVNEENAGLVLEKVDRSRWQLIDGEVLADADPMGTVQRFLRERTGHEAQNWFYLGSYQQEKREEQEVGHFFFAQGIEKELVKPALAPPPDWRWQWVPLTELRRGLLDGRFLNIHYAINVSLTLLMLPRLLNNSHIL